MGVETFSQNNDASKQNLAPWNGMPQQRAQNQDTYGDGHFSVMVACMDDGMRARWRVGRQR